MYFPTRITVPDTLPARSNARYGHRDRDHDTELDRRTNSNRALKFAQQMAPLLAVLGVAGLARHRQPTEETSARRLVVTRDGRQQLDRPAAVQFQIVRTPEYRGRDRAG